MQMHLLESTSANPLLRNFGSHKLRLCMMVLSELRATYWGADTIYRLFERAEAKLLERQTRDAAETASGSSVNIVPLTPESPHRAHIRPTDENTEVTSDGLHNPNESLWDEYGLDFIMSSSSFPPYDSTFEYDGSEVLQADMGPLNENMHVDCGINALLSLEEFNDQCFNMGQPT